MRARGELQTSGKCYRTGKGEGQGFLEVLFVDFGAEIILKLGPDPRLTVVRGELSSNSEEDFGSGQ